MFTSVDSVARELTASQRSHGWELASELKATDDLALVAKKITSYKEELVSHEAIGVYNLLARRFIAVQDGAQALLAKLAPDVSFRLTPMELRQAEKSERLRSYLNKECELTDKALSKLLSDALEVIKSVLEHHADLKQLRDTTKIEQQFAAAFSAHIGDVKTLAEELTNPRP